MDTFRLPVLMQDAAAPDPLDAQQFVAYPVLALADAPPAVRDGFAYFTIRLLDSAGPVRVRVHGQRWNPSFADGPSSGDPTDTSVPATDYAGFDQTITVGDDGRDFKIVAVPLTGATGTLPDPEFFELVAEPVDPSYVVRATAIGTIVAAVDFHVYDIGVYAPDVYQ